MFNSTASTQYVQAFANGSEALIRNVQTQMHTCQLAENLTLPLTINYQEYQSSYVCSPYNALILYAKEELEKVESKPFKMAIRCLLPILSQIFKRLKINQVVHINNWLLSTNLYPAAINDLDIATISQKLTQHYPQHTLAFRSLNHHSNHKLIQNFQLAGYLLVPSRQVYIYDLALHDYRLSHNYQIDKKLLNKTAYQYVDQSQISAQDIPRIVNLYQQLYIQKYSKHNPQFTEAYIQQLLQHPCFSFYGFRNQAGTLDAIGGRFIIENIITLPIVGYDLSKPQKLGLYRLVSVASQYYAEQNGLVFNASAGAAEFERLRGAQAYIEYSAVYVKHLPQAQQFLWGRLVWFLDQYVVPMMKREGL